jgi:hypothetical protein
MHPFTPSSRSRDRTGSIPKVSAFTGGLNFMQSSRMPSLAARPPPRWSRVTGLGLILGGVSLTGAMVTIGHPPRQSPKPRPSAPCRGGPSSRPPTATGPKSDPAWSSTSSIPGRRSPMLRPGGRGSRRRTTPPFHRAPAPANPAAIVRAAWGRPEVSPVYSLDGDQSHRAAGGRHSVRLGTRHADYRSRGASVCDPWSCSRSPTHRLVRYGARSCNLRGRAWTPCEAARAARGGRGERRGLAA